jgi:hypothetical protein
MVNSSLPIFGENGEVADESVAMQLQIVGRQVVEFARMRIRMAA